MISAVDLFCGAGGSSTGLVKAVDERGLKLDLLAINHWKIAIDTHTQNHPWARHLCVDLASVEADPSKLVPKGFLDLLIAVQSARITVLHAAENPAVIRAGPAPGTSFTGQNVCVLKKFS